MEKIKNLFDQKTIILLMILAVAAFIFYQIPDILMLFFVSFVIASALNPFVDWLEKRMQRGFAILTVYLAGFLLIFLFLAPLLGIAINQISSLIKNLPEYFSELYRLLGQLAITHRMIDKIPDFSQILSTASSYGREFIAGSISATLGFAASLIILFTAAMIILYMLIDKDYLTKTFLKFFPEEIRSRAESISVSISRKVGGFVIGQLISLLAVGVLTAIGYMLIGLDYSILLGLITGILDIVPIVGPIIAVAIAIIVALAQKPILAIWVLIIFTVIQWGTNVFVKPVVFSKFLDLHPLIIIFALLVAGSKLGVIGVIVSPAIAATICVLIDELYLSRINGNGESKNKEVL